MPPIPNRDEIVRLTTVLSSLVGEVQQLTQKVEALKDEHVFDLERNFAVIQSKNEEMTERIERIENNITWLVRTVAAQAVSLVGGIILWWIKTHSI